MRRTVGIAATVLAFSSSQAALAAPWTKTYVIEWYESAMHYGGGEGTTTPGPDCPAGSAPAPDWVKVMTEAGYSREQAEWLRNPANPTRDPINGQAMMAFRGENRQNVYDYPTTTPESGLPAVSGTIAEGFDLDGDAMTGFTGPDGRRGVDNAFYKALGCWKSMRGPARLSDSAKGANDTMREGGWTVLVVVSGQGKDPMNDRNVRIGLYLSGDKIVRDGAGGVASDYTFAIKPDAKLAAFFEGASRRGVITAAAPQTVWMRGPDSRELQLAKAKLSLEMKPDGSLSGLVGGYRPWLPIYEGLVAARGPVLEALAWVRLPDVYYALRRYADYSPTGPGGDKTYISYAMRVSALPAYVLTPDARATVSGVEPFVPAAADGTKKVAINR